MHPAKPAASISWRDNQRVRSCKCRSGHILGAIQFASGSAVGAFYLVFYTIVAYVAISFHMRVVKHYGSVVAVLVGNTRKAGTIALSFLVFPKPFSIMCAPSLRASISTEGRRRASEPAPSLEEEVDLLLRGWSWHSYCENFFLIRYVWGTLCVFGGLTATSWDKVCSSLHRCLRPCTFAIACPSRLLTHF